MTDNWDFVFRWPKTEFVALLEDDNYWLPTHIEVAVEMLEAFPLAGLYHCRHQESWDDGANLTPYKICSAPWDSRLREKGGGVVDPKEVIIDSLSCGAINSSSVVMRREVLGRLPAFDHRYLMGMDTLMWARAAMEKPVVYAPRLGVVYTYHAGNVSNDEIASGRAAVSARAARRIVLREALDKGVVNGAELERLLLRLPSDKAAAILMLMAHRSSAVDIQRAARRALKARRCLRHESRHLLVAGYVHASLLAYSDILDHARIVLAHRKRVRAHPG